MIIFQDTFPGPARPLVNPWVQQSGNSTGLAMVGGGLVRCAADGESTRYLINTPFANDQWAEIDFQGGNANGGVGLCLRASGAFNSDVAYVLYTAGDGTAGSTLNIVRQQAGFNALTSSPVLMSAGDRIRFEVRGDTLYWYLRRGLIGKFVDTNIASGAAGANAYCVLATDTAFGNYAAGDFSINQRRALIGQACL